MTRKEIIEALGEIRDLLPNMIDEPAWEWIEAIDQSIASLQPWKKLSEETPKKVGWYHTYDPRRLGAGRFNKAQWIGGQFIQCNRSSRSITHWTEIVGPEEE